MLSLRVDGELFFEFGDVLLGGHGEMRIYNSLKRAVAVKQLPEEWSAKKERIFLREMQSCMNVDRPYVVLDCSTVRQLDKSVIHMLLCCLEEAMKRNGDVKLAGIPLGTESILELTGVSRLFDIFETTADAVSSFHQPSVTLSQPAVPDYSRLPAERVA